ncbi:MAG: thiamine biosynthesis protein [Thermodesulfobacteriota bacterium]
MNRCLALFSGGLDSILACRVIQAQGIDVLALKFISPFFDYELLAREEAYQAEIKERYDINVKLCDISAEYIKMLANPRHGYGKNFNPCLDCKILIITRAKELMAKYNASFLITGEVVGQRPMSQRKDTLRVIERDSATDDILLRPLCAQSQKPTLAERSGMVDRDKLPRFSGRNRTPQMELAKAMGIHDYPSPAGGCVLTEQLRSARIKALFGEDESLRTPANILFLLQGRQFRLPQGGWLALGRNQGENKRIEGLREPGDQLLNTVERPGPTGLLRYGESREDQALAAAIMIRYAKKTSPPDQPGQVSFASRSGEKTMSAAPLAREGLAKLYYPAEPT